MDIQAPIGGLMKLQVVGYCRGDAIAKSKVWKVVVPMEESAAVWQILSYQKVPDSNSTSAGTVSSRG